MIIVDKKDTIYIQKIKLGKEDRYDFYIGDMANILDTEMENLPLFFYGNPADEYRTWFYVRRGEMFCLQSLVKFHRTRSLLTVFKAGAEINSNIYNDSDVFFRMYDELTLFIKKELETARKFVDEIDFRYFRLPIFRDIWGEVLIANTINCYAEFLTRVELRDLTN